MAVMLPVVTLEGRTVPPPEAIVKEISLLQEASKNRPENNKKFLQVFNIRTAYLSGIRIVKCSQYFNTKHCSVLV